MPNTHNPLTNTKMRTLTSKLTMLFVALAIGFAACEKSPVEEQKPEPKPDPQPEVELTITSGTQEVVSFEGGEVVITYRLSGQSDTLPVAECDATWISDIAVAESTITLNVAANETEESRQAWVKIEFATALRYILRNETCRDYPIYA